MKWYISLSADPPDLSSKPQHSNFFCLPGSEKRNKSPQADKKPWKFLPVAHV